MIGLMYILAFVVYLAISAVVIVAVGRWAGRRGKSQWTWVIGTALVMYSLVFWDLVPTLIVREVLCARLPTTITTKPATAWAKEHSRPRVLPNALVQDSMQTGVRADDLAINDYLALRTTSNPIPILPLAVLTQTLVDRQTNEVLAERQSVHRANRGPTDRFKLWLPSTPCGQSIKAFDEHIAAFKQVSPATK